MTRKLASLVLDNPHKPFLLRQAEKGDLFTLRDFSSLDSVDEHLVWVKGDFDRSSNKFSCHRYDDVNDERFYSASKLVYYYFTF